jgi:hypothetical protein
VAEGAHRGLREDDHRGTGVGGALREIRDEAEVLGRVGRCGDLGEGDPHETSS